MFRISKEVGWLQRTEYDKVVHFLGSAYVYGILSNFISHAFWWTLLAGVVWEIKDGFVPYEKYGSWGGEGFSWKDIVADILGILTMMILLLF